MAALFNVILGLLLVPWLLLHGVPVTIDNLKPRLDIDGNIIDAHDGSIQQFKSRGLYYMHAMQYGLCEEPPRYGCDGVSTCQFQLRGKQLAMCRQAWLVSAVSRWTTTLASGRRRI